MPAAPAPAASNPAPVVPDPAPAATHDPVPAATIATGGGGGTPLFTPTLAHPLLLQIPLLLLLPLVVVVLPHSHLHLCAAPSSVVAPTCSGAFTDVCSLVPAQLCLIAPCTWFIHTGLIYGCSSSFVLDFSCWCSFSHLLLS